MRQQVASQGSWDGAAESPPHDGLPAEPLYEDCKLHAHAMEQVTRTIEGEIIPRLMLAHRLGASAAPASGVATRPIEHDQVVELARLSMTADVEVAHAYVDALRSAGHSLEALLLDLLAPAARHLGDMWNNDLCDFTEVTVGLLRLQQLLHRFTPAFESAVTPWEVGPRVLLAPASGEQHTLGLSMVAEFFRHAGWDVWDEPSATTEEIVRLVKAQHFDLIGFSLSVERRMDALAATIHAARRSSRNRNVCIMVGGPAFAGQPDRVAMVGADATADDGREAVSQAQNLLSLLAVQRR